MRYLVGLVSAAVAVVLLCGTGSAGAQTNVTFPDPHLESAIREALEKPTGPLTAGDLAGLTSMIASTRQITNLSGLEYATNLIILSFLNNDISDAGPLSALTHLWFLDLRGNRVTNLAPLLGLTSLQELYLDRNGLTNISGLQNLPALKVLELVQNLLDVTPGSPAFTIITNLQKRGVSVVYLPQNEPPLIVLPPPWLMPLNHTSTLSLSVSDDVTPASQLVVTVSADDPALFPQDSLVLEQSGNDITWNLTLTPATGKTGTTALTIIAADDTALIATNRLTVTVYYTPSVSFPDPNLEAVVRNNLGLQTGAITAYDMQSLYWLEASWRNITNLSGLEWATNLDALYLAGNAATNLSPLLGLPLLQNLDLGYNNLRDLSLLQGLTHLSTLGLDGNPVSDMAQLAGLPNLISLSAQSCYPSNLAGIGSLVGLQTLFLRGDSLRSATPLAPLTNLLYLDLRDNPLASTAGLGALSQLRHLELGQCTVSNLSSLQGLAHLEYLAAERNNIRDVSPLSTLTNLAYLILDSNPVSSFAPLASLPRLVALSAGHCPLTNLASLQGLTTLQSLYLANDGIGDLVPLAALTNLSTLYLAGNSLVDVSCLAALANLTALDLASCSLSNIGSLPPMTSLRSLNLGYDSISDISSLDGLTNLYSLYLNANRLTNISSLDSLNGLRWVDLTRNLLDLTAGSTTMIAITNLQKQGAWVNYDPQNQPPSFYLLRTNWVNRPNVPATLQFALLDDVTRADKVSLTATCTSAGSLSNSVITLVRTAFYLASAPMPPILFPPFRYNRQGLGPYRWMPDPASLLRSCPTEAECRTWELTATPTSSQTGTMTVTLTAVDDTGLSTNATVCVTVQPPDTVDGAVLGATNLVWQTGGNAPWFGQTNISHGGSAAAQSGPISVNEESWLETTVTGPGILTFWWKLTATNYGSYVAFTTSRGGTLELEANADWRKEMVSIPAGECVLGWSYAAPWSTSPSAGCWVDDVSFVPTTPNFWLDLASGPYAFGTFVTLRGEPGGLYELQFSTNLVNWSPLDRVVMDLVNGGFSVLVGDPSLTGTPRFYRARQLSPDTMWFAPPWFDAVGSPVLRLFSQPGIPCEILASTNLLNWSAVATITNITGTLSFTNAAADPSKQFYRAQRAP